MLELRGNDAEQINITKIFVAFQLIANKKVETHLQGCRRFQLPIDGWCHCHRPW